MPVCSHIYRHKGEATPPLAKAVLTPSHHRSKQSHPADARRSQCHTLHLCWEKPPTSLHAHYGEHVRVVQRAGRVTLGVNASKRYRDEMSCSEPANNFTHSLEIFCHVTNCERSNSTLARVITHATEKPQAAPAASPQLELVVQVDEDSHSPPTFLVCDTYSDAPCRRKRSSTECSCVLTRIGSVGTTFRKNIFSL